MKNLRRKALTLILAAGMVAGMAAPVAASPETTSDAGIYFLDTGWNWENEIIDPDDPGLGGLDPDDPGGGDGGGLPTLPPELAGIEGKGLWFGEHELVPGAQSFVSQADETGSGARAGFVVSRGDIAVEWAVNVSIGEFRLENGTPTLEGFELTLNRDGNPVIYGGWAGSENTVFSSSVVLSAGASANIAGGPTRGLFGANYAGVLDVLSAEDIGLASAELIWTFGAVPGGDAPGGGSNGANGANGAY